MASSAPAPTAGASEQTITFHNEQWTAEVARLLLEVDEGWVGFRNDAAWSWCDETYTVFAAVCRERQWPCNSEAACVTMMHALRTGAINMQLSSTTRSSDGCAQWSLAEMRELGAQMKRVVDGKSPTLRWAAQFLRFVEAMKATDVSYRVEDRTVEDFAARAGKYVPEPILTMIDPNQTKGKTRLKKTRRTRRSPTTQRRVTRGQAAAMEAAEPVESGDELLVPRRNTRANTARATTKKRGRIRSEESEGDSSYYDPMSEDEVEYWEDDSALRESRPEEDSPPASQELTSQGELQPAGEQLTSSTVDPGRSSLPEIAVDEEKSDEATDRSGPSSAASRKRRQDAPAQNRASSRQDTAEDQAGSANGSQYGGTPTRQPSRKYQRVKRPTANDGNSNNGNSEPPHVFRSLNPYDRVGKPWGEFVVEVLLAERTARNEDELDYVQFVRGLYEI
ncbi:hypothetical protein PRNP1_001400 [Phytophthora ramorum]